MVVAAAAEGAGEMAAEVAAVLSERGLGGDDVDLAHRLDALRRDRSRRAQEARQMARRWAEMASRDRGRSDSEPSVGALLALAYPDRIAKNRGGGAGAFLLANGRGGTVDPASPLAREPYLAVAELTGTATRGRIVLAAAISLQEIEARFAASIERRDEVVVRCRKQQPARTAQPAARRHRSERCAAAGRAERGQAQSCSPKASRAPASIDCRGPRALRQWRDRVAFLRAAEGEEWPDLSDAALAATAGEWLAPALVGKTALGQLTPR